MRTGVVVCRACNGKGSTPDYRRCDHCNGWGKVIASVTRSGHEITNWPKP